MTPMRSDRNLERIRTVDLILFGIAAADHEAMRRFLCEVATVDGEVETVAALADRLQWSAARLREIQSFAIKSNLIHLAALGGKPARRWVRWDLIGDQS